MLTRFRYVDFAAAGQAGFRNNVVSLEEVPALVERYRAYECYASLFVFSDEILLYRAENQVEGRPSIAGYDGRVAARFLSLDIDAAAPAVLGQALDLTRRVHHVLADRWQLGEESLHVYFSGSKGFHLQVDVRVFGRVAPSRDLHRIFSRLRLELLRELPDSARSLFDLAIGDKVRLLRLPNTRHRKSGLFKVPVSRRELMDLDAERIRSLADRPRPLERVGAGGLVPLETVRASPIAVGFFHRARRTIRRQRGPHPYRFAKAPNGPEEALCAARLEMWRSSIPPGNRNNVAIRLASAFRIGGYGRQETEALLLSWNHRQRSPLTEHEIHLVVASAYARPYPYAYGCHDEVIRSFCPFADRLDECEDRKKARSDEH